jgi:predicted RNase H-like HicB family nuclease
MTLLVVTSSPYSYGHPGFVAHCVDEPDVVGHGEGHDEAVADLLQQIEERTLH